MDFGGFKEFGLVGLVVGVMFFILWRMIVWVMAFVKEITVQQIKEREVWSGIIARHNDSLTKINQSIERHDEKAEERGKYVREEHKQMIEVLGRINGYKEH